MRILQTNRFKKVYKKLHLNQLQDVNCAIKTIAENHGEGEQKRGDLSWLSVYKFMSLGQLLLLGYTFEIRDEIILTLVDIGPHENFYRDIKTLKR